MFMTVIDRLNQRPGLPPEPILNCMVNVLVPAVNPVAKMTCEAATPKTVLWLDLMDNAVSSVAALVVAPEIAKPAKMVQATLLLFSLVQPIMTNALVPVTNENDCAVVKPV